MLSRLFGVAAVGLWALASMGCNFGGARVWTEAVTESHRVDASGLSSLEVRTHNGGIRYQGDGTTQEATITVTKKAGGRTRKDAEQAFDALDITIEPNEAGTCRVGWAWKTPRRSRWSADVNFMVVAPSKLNLMAESHNGAIGVTGAAGETRLVTHNGHIEVTASGPMLRAETHNGGIQAGYEGRDLRLSTHNGAIRADLSRCGPVGGELSTHNGAIQLTVSSTTAADIECSTHNGRIQFDPPVSVGKVSRTNLEGKLGPGGPPLELETHNGSIRVKKSDG